MARPRRASGEGQISWSSSHGVYVGTLIIGRNPATGRNLLKTCRATIKGKTNAGYLDCEQKLTALKGEVEAETQAEEAAADPDNYTVWQCILDWHAWVPSQQKTSKATADRYLSQARGWIKPDIGNVRLVDLDLAMLSDLLEKIAPHLGADTIRDIRGTLRRAIQYARTKKKFTGPNLATEIELPRAGHAPKDADFLTWDQVNLILTQTAGTAMHALVTLGFMLGLRPGEIRALKWEHVDFKTGILSVLRYARVDGDGETKTKTSRRRLQMPDKLVAALIAHRENWGGHEYVFTNEDGDQLNKNNLRWRVKVVFRAAGLDHQDPYIMRHTFASLMDDAGMDHQEIADTMGHRDKTTFERVYRHRLKPEIRAVASVMNKAWASRES